MQKTFLITGLVLLLNISLIFAHEHGFTKTKQLIDSGISCDKLTDEQLEAIGDYYMEQMHPGEQHEIMDEMMGGEGSNTLKQAHINMARRFYCNEGVGRMMDVTGFGGMMGMMGPMWGGSWLMMTFWFLFWIAALFALILLIIWLYKKITE